MFTREQHLCKDGREEGRAQEELQCTPSKGSADGVEVAAVLLSKSLCHAGPRGELPRKGEAQQEGLCGEGDPAGAEPWGLRRMPPAAQPPGE